MHTVTLIPGDGIGIEWEVLDAGLPAIERFGIPLPTHVLDSIRNNKVALKGPVTTPVGAGFRSINVALRQELDLYASVRPCVLYPGVPSHFETIDLVVIRENTEDVYEGIEFEEGSHELEKLRGYVKYMHGYEIAKDAGVSI